MEVNFSRNVGDKVFYLDRNNLIHQSTIFGCRMVSETRRNADGIVQNEFFIISGRPANEYYHSSQVFDSANDAANSLVNQVVIDN